MSLRSPLGIKRECYVCICYGPAVSVLRRPIAEVKQRLKIYYLELLLASEGTLSPVPVAFAIVST
jgi:hypothetical protein